MVYTIQPQFKHQAKTEVSGINTLCEGYLTEVLCRRAVIIEDSDDPRSQNLQSWNMSWKDAESTCQCWYVNLPHAGVLEEHLELNTVKFTTNICIQCTVTSADACV